MSENITYIDSIKGKPIEDVLKRKQMARDYADGRITKAEYDEFVEGYRTRMKALSQQAWKNLRQIKT
jgi:radical SAM superfamily enzyme